MKTISQQKGFTLGLRILIDAHLMGSRETGNETYTINLLNAMAGMYNIECGAAVLPGYTLPGFLHNIDAVTLEKRGNWSRILFGLNKAFRKWQADILHVNYIGPLLNKFPFVTTIHDVSFKHFPAFFSLRDRLLFATLLPVTLKRAGAVIAVSQHAKKEILNYYPFVKDKVHVTLEAASPVFRRIHEQEILNEVKMRFGVTNQYILAVGNLQPRKNIKRLIDAFAFVQKKIKNLKLVIAGKPAWKGSQIYDAVKRLSLEGNVVFTGYLQHDELVFLYNAAACFVYPSLYEGFGLPVLEAMACGVPVVTSNTSSIPEVAGNAAILIDPYSTENIAGAIMNILENRDLALRLSEEGLQHVKKFSWQRTALETIKVYNSVLNNS